MPSVKQSKPDPVSSSGCHALQTDKFQALVDALSQKLGPSSGIDSEDVDAQELQDLMQDYISSEPEWAKYALGDASRNYTRNLVDKGNGKSNLVVLPLLGQTLANS